MDNRQSRDMKRVVIAGMIGNALEWYDFALYGQLTGVLAKLFFSELDDASARLATFATFAAGFLVRPLGGVLFGWLGDRYGRRFSLALSIVLMAVPTAAIGLLPTYAQAGMIAPALLVLIRMLQGLSLGGAFSGSIVYIVEHAAVRKRGIAGSASMASLVLGMLLGSLVATITTTAMSQQALMDWGWRLPFLFGLAVGLVGLYIRKYTSESPSYEEAKAGNKLSATPVKDVLGRHSVELVQGIAIYLSVTVPFYLFTIYMITFLSDPKGAAFSARDALLLNGMSLVVMLIGVLRGAQLSDRIGRKPVLTAAALSLAAIAWPVFWEVNQGGFWSAFAALAVFGLLLGAYMGPVPAVLVELFPTAVRGTGMALAYNISATFFGGTAPMYATWLEAQTGCRTIGAFCVIAAAVATLYALQNFRDRFAAALD